MVPRRAADIMSRSSALEHRLRPVPSPDADAPASAAWAGEPEDEGYRAAEAEVELELDDCLAHDPYEHDALPFADEAYPALAPAQREALRRELQDRLGAYLSRGRARVVLTDNLRTMLSIKRSKPNVQAGDPHGVYTFRLHHMFVDAPPMVLRAVVAYAERQDNDSAQLLRAFIDANEDSIRERSEPRPVTIETEGRHHDLRQVFDALNAEYFGGAIKARITWGPRTKRKRGRSSIKLGSYTVEDELIRIHPGLDASDVPAYYLAWVIYHEMLHEIHDMPIVEGRRVYHTRAFRQAEAKFAQYPEAVLWERKFLHKLLDR